MALLECFKCGKSVIGVRAFSCHFRRHHAIMVSKSYSSGFYCKQGNCDQHFLRFDSLLRHIKRWHVNTIDKNVSSTHASIKSNNLNTSDTMEVQLSEEENLNESEQHNAYDEGGDNNFQESFDPSISARRFIANLRMLFGLTGKTVAAITNAVQCLISDISDFIQKRVIDFCEKQSINLESPDTQELLNYLNFENIFVKIDTLQGQINAVKNIYHYVDSIEIPLGFRLQQHFDLKEQMWVQKRVYETSQYISIIETLKMVMSHASMWNYVHSEQNSSDDLLVTFRDGITFKHLFFQRYLHALRIQLYYDDVVVNNPLGSKVHPHKIGAFYFVIQNLPQYVNSSLGGIHILTLCHTADIQKYGMKAILKSFLIDLNKLESDNGVPVMLNGNHFVLRASIAAVCADGLAAHQLLGFLSPSAKYFVDYV